jgi:nucleotide-binding universal stress UspA family protein
MTTQPAAELPRFVVVAGIDVSPAAEDVIASAVANVRDRANAEVHLIHALDVGGDVSLLPLLAEARKYLGDAGQRCREACAARVVTHIAYGRPWREIVQAATNVHADLIVVGTHGRSGVARLLLGSQAEMVVQKASCPVLVVRPKEYAASTAPEIEPACPDCLVVQQQTSGERLWCSRHSERHPRAHLHYEFPEAFARGTMLVQPE